jgi:adenine-specific DNA-methyltransferase
MRLKGYDVWSGDLLSFAHQFQVARIKFPNEARFSMLMESLSLNNLQDLCRHMNSIAAPVGWFVEEYSIKRNFFTRDNAMKIEACRSQIDQWDGEGVLNQDEKAVLLAGLINSMDKVANTAGTYYAYLKNWNRKALKPFCYELLPPQQDGGRGVCYHENAVKLLSRQHYDVIYLDPPYNERSYAHYYHLPETIAMGVAPVVHGKSGISNGPHMSSEFNRKGKASFTLSKLLEAASFRFLFFHYADNGLIPPNNVVEILSSYGKIEKFSIDTKGYYTGAGSKVSSHQVYLLTYGA